MSDTAPEVDSAVEIGQIPQLDKPFEDLTEEHRRTRESVEDQIDEFIENPDKAIRPLGIRGPYRSGKTQLEYHAFDYAWRNGVPAVYISSPKEELESFLDSDEDSIATWWDQRAQEELKSLISDGEMEWFPDVPAEQRRRWVAERVEGKFDVDDLGRYVLVLDELEQGYEGFLQAAGTDDDNPLRKLNDELPNTLSIWSFGLLSAYEFVGDADMGRPREVSIPPIDIDTVHEMLVRKNPALVPLENVIWWASRGRAAWAFKLVEEMDETALESPMEWLDSLRDYRSVEVDMVSPIWGEETGHHEEAAAALAFQEDGYDDWLLSSETSLSLDDALEVVEELLAEIAELDSATPRTKQVLYEQLRDVIEGLALRREDTQLLPINWLNEDETADALLDLLQYHLVSFEAGTDEREAVYDILEEAKGQLSDQWVQKLQTRDVVVDQPSWTAATPKLKDAFPPLVMNPNRLTEESSDELRSQMNTGMEIKEHDLVNMYFCPTQDTFDETVAGLTQSPDITQPTLIFTADNVDVDLDETATYLQQYDVLCVETKDVQRVWDFIAQIYGYLRDDPDRTDPYYLDRDVVDRLIEEADEREVRTAIETLYKHLTRQTSIQDVRDFRDNYITQFTRPSADDVIWAEDTWAGEPTWTNAPLGDQRLSLVMLLGWGSLPNWNEEGRIPRKIREALDSDEKNLIPTNDFKYTELINNNFSSTADGGFLSSVTDIREKCRQRNEGPISTVTNLSNLLGNLIDIQDPDQIYEQLDEMESVAEDIPILSGLDFPDPVANENSDAVIRAAMVDALVRDGDYVGDKINRVHTALLEDKQTIDGYIDDVEDVESELPPIDGIECPQIEVSTAELETYRENIVDVTEALEKATEKIENNSDIRPTIYVLAELARRYEVFMGDKLDELRDAVPTTGNIARVRGLQNTATELHSTVNETDNWSQYIDTEEDIHEAVTNLLSEMLDLTSEAGNEISVPDENDVIDSLETVAERRMQAIQALLEDFNDLKQADTQLEKSVEGSQRELKQTIDGIIAEGANNE